MAVSAHYPASITSILARCYALFIGIEEKLKACRNPTWVQAYEGNSRLTQQKRLSLTMLSLGETGQDCLTIAADVFETHKSGFIDHVYWDNLLDSATMKEILASDDDTPFNPDSYTIM